MVHYFDVLVDEWAYVSPELHVVDYFQLWSR